MAAMAGAAAMSDHSYSEPGGFGQCANLSTASSTPLLKNPLHTESSLNSTSLLNLIDTECAKISIRPVLRSTIDTLGDDGFHLHTDIVKEMSKQCPYLLEIMMTIACGSIREAPADNSLVGPIAAAFSILMHHRNQKLSAWQRLMTCVGIRGHMEDSVFDHLNKVNVTLCSKSKLNILTSAATKNQQNLGKKLEVNPLPVIVGDNLDLTIRTNHQSSEKAHKSLHYFASLMVFPRIITPTISNVEPNIEELHLSPDQFLLSCAEQDRLHSSFTVLLGRIMVEKMPFFKWLDQLLPKHLPHQFSLQMSQKSSILPLPLQFKNECYLEQCVDIMDGYQGILQDIHLEAHGTADRLFDHQVPVFGDQLTRVRLQGVKALRHIVPPVRERFKNIGAIVITQWHNKQDFLEKCYKALYKPESRRVPGTLSYFKTMLRRSDVNGRVKTNYRAHEDLLLTVGKAMLAEQLLSFLGMESTADVPQNPLLRGVTNLPQEQQIQQIQQVLKGFLVRWDYATSAGPNPAKMDSLQSYCSNLCHWVLQLMSMNDTAKEGDVDRLVLNSKAVIPFFYQHSPGSKYLAENIDFLLKTQHMLSPLQSLQALECSFVNTHGGSGNNKEIDLAMESSVANNKVLIRQLGANKTEKACMRATGAADAVARIVKNASKDLLLKNKSDRHTKSSSLTDEERVQKCINDLKPFIFVPNRQCRGFEAIRFTPSAKIDINALHSRIDHIVDRLSLGMTNDDDETDSDSDDN